MKIVQSFWTRPYVHAKSGITGFEGGWPSRGKHFCAWALSCLQLRKFYDRVELVTDDVGKKILIDQLKLPYTDVSVALNDLDNVDPGLWALGKLYAYGQQREPFLHMDGDIFIFNPIEESVIGAPFFAQNLDIGYPAYHGLCKTTWDAFTWIPPYFEDVFKTERADCANLGIVGGTDIEFLKQCVKEAFEFYERNKESVIYSCWNYDRIMVNIVLEQTVMYQYAKYCGKEITCLFPDDQNNPPGIGSFLELTKNKGYVHCYGWYKREKLSYSYLEKKLQEDHPEYYKRIMELYGDSSDPGEDIRFASVMEKVWKLEEDEFMDLELTVTDSQWIERNEKSIDLSEPLTPHTLQVLFTTYGLSSYFRRVDNYGNKEEIKLGIILLYIDLFAESMTVREVVQKMADFVNRQSDEVVALLYDYFKVSDALQFREVFKQHILYVIKEMMFMSILSIAEQVGTA